MMTEHNRLAVTGELNFTTIMPIWQSSLALLTACSTLTIDLSKVTATNSAGLILLIEWLKYAKHNNKIVIFENLPPQIQSIAQVAGLKIP
jgi:phospholipid transport system transporter-binding protein